jgi:hypothetical protein
MATEKDWHPSRKNPDNICRYIKGVGLVTVFLGRDGNFRFAYGGLFSEPYPTREAAQLGAGGLHEVSAPAQRASAQERNTMAIEATATTAAVQQHPSKAQFDKLVAYVQELVKDHNALEQRVIELERREEVRRNHENQQPSVGRNKTNPKFQGRDAALEAEAS